ncbi:hypothetical protein [Streptomyces sp. NPDC056399]|uniref:hypothetical protein n=1 Tax=Streptomyces sp. NPDC056399 TaxID=3345807 RepID=UPI0035E32971
MIRYGFAIKALPKGGKPFGDDDQDEKPVAADNAAPPEEAAPETGASVPPGGAGLSAGASSGETVTDETSPDEEQPDRADEETPPDGGAPHPADDARPWSGDPYDEGDETDPATAFAAYKGAGGEEAWLDRAPDGTLTGWVRDETGQVWRYTDPSVWAIDVDDAPMTRTHSQATAGPPPDEHGGQDPLFPLTR